MVQVLQETSQGNNIGQGKLAENDCTMETTTTGATNGQLDDNPLDIDHELLQETRNLLKEAYEAAEKDTYAAGHYERLMDAKSPMTCWRYILHCHRSPKESVDLMKRALVWRQENDIDQLGPKHLAKDLFLKAPAGWTGKSKDGQQVIYVIGKNYRKPDPSVKHIVRKFITFSLLSFENNHQDDLEQFLAIFDTSETTYSNMDLDFAAWLISVRDYFPRRFKAIYIIGIPFLIRPIVKLIISWLPDNYKQIVHCGTFDDLVKASVDEDQLPYEVGGAADDRWRLAPPGCPWASESRDYTPEVMSLLERAICFNIPQERIDKVIQMQKDYDLNNNHQ